MNEKLCFLSHHPYTFASDDDPYGVFNIKMNIVVVIKIAVLTALFFAIQFGRKKSSIKVFGFGP
jgi:hypothetical protein